MSTETLAAPARLSRWMSNNQATRMPLTASPAQRVETRILWILLAVGAALMLAAAASGEDDRDSHDSRPTASRTDRFQTPLSAGATVRVENVNGEIVATPGKAFSAVVTTTVAASSRSRADEILAQVRVEASTAGSQYRLQTVWPRQTGWSRGHRREGFNLHCEDCRITSRYEIVVPPSTSVNLQTVNGEVRVRDLDGDLELHSVNGTVQALGARRSVRAQTVNGKIEASARAIEVGTAWDLKTVNGSVLLTLPKDAKFDWNASTMGGSIASTFALPPGRGEPVTAPAPPAPEGRTPRSRTSAARAIVVETGDGEATVIDTEELARQIEESLREVEVEVGDSGREAETVRRRVQIPLPGRSYSARVGGGGARVQSSTLNGNITLLAAGTAETDAKSLVSGRRAIVVTVPRMVEMRREAIHIETPRVVHVHPPAPPAPTAPLAPLAILDEDEEGVVRGDIAGDFLSTSNGSYQVGKVTGKVRILTHSGEIHVASAGSGADVKTYGGDIQIGPIHGDLKAQTLAGDVRAGEVAGSAVVETSGGDIRIDRVAGSASARTGGGDIVLPAVGGSVQAETGGGEVRVGVLSRSVKGGISIRNSGGDVVLTLPSDFQGDIDLAVEGADDPDDLLIRSDFSGVAVTRGSDSQRASGSLNGGGPRVLVRTTSGSIRLRRSPNTGS